MLLLLMDTSTNTIPLTKKITLPFLTTIMIINFVNNFLEGLAHRSSLFPRYIIDDRPALWVAIVSCVNIHETRGNSFVPPSMDFYFSSVCFIFSDIASNVNEIPRVSLLTSFLAVVSHKWQASIFKRSL